MVLGLHSATVAGLDCQADFSDKGVEFLKTQATALLVENTGTSRSDEDNGWFTQAQVDEIDRFLAVRMDLPETTIDGSGYFNDTDALCDRTWTCAKQEYIVCPGQKLSTTQFRDFTIDTDAGHTAGAARPRFDFYATEGKTYSIIMIDLLSPSFAEKLRGIGLNQECFMHYVAFNFDDANDLNELEGTSANEPMGTLQGAGNLNPDEPNKYTFMLFEHDEEVTFDSMELDGAIENCELGNILGLTGLDNADLVSFSYFNGVASGSTRFNSLVNPDLAPLVPAFGLTCDVLLDGVDDDPVDMCDFETGLPDSAAAVGISTIIGALGAMVAVSLV